VSLRELQRTFASVVLDRGERAVLEAEIRSDARASAKERVAVYANMVRLRFLEVLGDVFPRTLAFTGGAAFAAAAERYVVEHASRSPSLRGYGAEFPALLDGAAGELARLEWLRHDVFDAADEPTLTHGRVAALPPDALVALPLQRLAASGLLPAAHDLDALYRALIDGETPIVRATATQLFVWRDGTTVFHRAVPPAEAALLARISSATPLGLLCEEVADDRTIDEAADEVFGLVGRWIADRVLVDLR
jgi:hypothetical protein